MRRRGSGVGKRRLKPRGPSFVMSMRFLDLESSYFVDSESRDFVDAESPRFLDGESTEFLYWC